MLSKLSGAIPLKRPAVKPDKPAPLSADAVSSPASLLAPKLPIPAPRADPAILPIAAEPAMPKEPKAPPIADPIPGAIKDPAMAPSMGAAFLKTFFIPPKSFLKKNSGLPVTGLMLFSLLPITYRSGASPISCIWAKSIFFKRGDFSSTSMGTTVSPSAAWTM